MHPGERSVQCAVYCTDSDDGHALVYFKWQEVAVAAQLPLPRAHVAAVVLTLCQGGLVLCTALVVGQRRFGIIHPAAAQLTPVHLV
jgi:hypothetical protein